MNNKIEIPIAKNPDNVFDQFEAFVEIVRILRKDCPWDKEQTHESIAQLMVEETYEAINSIYEKNDKEFSKELGDLLLHIVMHSVMAEERSAFDLKEVIEKISHKMITRHPHVFGDEVVKDTFEVLGNWEKIKQKEKTEDKDKSVLSGVPNNLPALLRAERIQHKVSRVGFDWDNKDDVWNKVYEELNELKHELEAENKEKARAELGDFIFAIVNTARHYGIVAEEALHLTNNKFTQRFRFIEQRAIELNRKLDDMTLEEMDVIWNESKSIFK